MSKELNTGYFCVDRDILNTFTWQEHKRDYIPVFIYLNAKANWQEKKWKNQIVKPGQYITSLKHLSRDLDFGVTTIRNALKTLEEDGLIKVQGIKNKYTIITIIDYDKKKYKSKKDDEEEQKESTVSKKRPGYI